MENSELNGKMWETNQKAVMDGFIANLLAQSNELTQSVIAARRQQEELFSARLEQARELSSANATNHRIHNNQAVSILNTDQILARKELDSGPTEAAMAAMSSAQGQKTQDAASLSSIVQAINALNQRLDNLENKG